MNLLRALRRRWPQLAVMGFALALIGLTATLSTRVLIYTMAPTITSATAITTTSLSTLLVPPVTGVSAPGPSSTGPPATTAVPTTGTPPIITTTPPPLLTPAPEAEATIADLTANLRASVGLPAVAIEAGLQTYARAWASHMAATGVLSHSSIGDLLGAWAIVGENVGMGANASAIFDALLSSPDHLEVMVGVGFTAGGVGAVIDGQGRLWVCQVFGGRTLPPVTVPSVTVPSVTLPSVPIPTLPLPTLPTLP